MDDMYNNMILYAFTLGFDFCIWEEWKHKADLRGYANLHATKFVSSDKF